MGARAIGQQPDLAGAAVAPAQFAEECTAPDCLDNRLRYAARLKASSCQAARIWAGLRYPFFSMSHSAL